MRTLIIAGLALLLVGASACKTKPRAEPVAQPDRNPYKNVMPDKIKKQVEDTQKREEDRNDKVYENAKQ
jgi:hypothetical protein